MFAMRFPKREDSSNQYSVDGDEHDDPTLKTLKLEKPYGNSNALSTYQDCSRTPVEILDVQEQAQEKRCNHLCDVVPDGIE